MIKHSKLPRSWRFAGRAAVALMAVVMISQTTEAQEPKKMYEVEGITEYPPRQWRQTITVPRQFEATIYDEHDRQCRLST